MIRELFEILAPTFLAALSGWLWVRSGRRFDREMIGDLIMLIGAPCLIFSSLVSLDVSASAMLVMAQAAVTCFAIVALIGIVALRVLKLPGHTFLSPLVFGNQGNLGVPLCLFAFGAEGQALALVFFTIGATLQFSAGLFIWSGRFDPKELIRNPVGLAALAAATMITFELPVPSVLTNTTRLLGGFAIPLMLVALGVAVAEMRVTDLRRSLLMASTRLGVGVIVGFTMANCFDFTGIARGVLILQCAMPAAVFNHLLAQRYDRSPEQVASIVVVSTLLTAFALPFLLPFIV
ncbi:MAG: AEC family transporter [Myxococcales bacterium]|nr:AEC family transporter [Myxococcales bacterium]HIM02383.1 AEC family transporter [Myxococcales bacterium]